MINLYLWIKAFHIIAMAAWMAGLFYLPRLFVYHADAAPGSAVSETFKVMERRLAAAIMTPAAIVTWVLGLGLAHITGQFSEPQAWFLIKLGAVLGLSGFHLLLLRHKQDFAADRRLRPARYYRMINEIPTVLLIVIVIMAVVKPFI
ncbi:MAG: protoporphyrinogen oxidase HemJ [Rhizobiales bacterium]|nr:protoporphyrinogen oxidase HemJ [Hyphomicrobiales bacterium]